MLRKIFLVFLLGLCLVGLLQSVTYQEQPDVVVATLSEGFIAYDKYGSGDHVIIAIHGSPGSKENFRTLAPMLDATVYALDMYGFGSSSKHVKDFGYDHAADVVKEFVDAQGIESATVLGYSWGGAVAMEFAHRYPQQTDSIILLSSMGIQEGEPTGSYFLEHFRYAVSYPFVVYYPGAFGGDLGWRKGFVRSYMDANQRTIRNILPQVSTKALVLHGNKDSVIQPWVAQTHHDLLPNSTLVWFDGGHGQVFGDFSSSDEVPMAIKTFIGDLYE